MHHIDRNFEGNKLTFYDFYHPKTRRYKLVSLLPVANTALPCSSSTVANDVFRY